MIRNVAPEQRLPEFPQVIKKGFATVKIYEVKNRERTNYTISYVSTDGRVRRNFADLDVARREANNIALNLNKGDMEVLRLTGQDKQIYVEAQQAIAPTGLPLHCVAHEFARCWNILGHAGIVEAARYYKKHVETSLPAVLVADAVERFAAAKQKQGVSKVYLKDIRGLLGRFGAHFRCNIATVGPEDLRAYLDGLKVGMVAKNNHRRLIVGLFTFARDEGWLPDNRETAAHRLGAYKVKERDVEIFTPAEVARLLVHAAEDFLPWVALIAFGGVRNEELHKGLSWEAINFERGYLIISSAVAKTGRKRKIALPENLLQWLGDERYRHRSGPIFNRDFRKPLAKMCERARVKWKRNGLRHSFGSYRMEMVKNAGQVALEMGNSAAMVMKHYFDIVEVSAAREYWAINPLPRTDHKIVRMGRR